jgi:hypothetical protein
VTREIIAVISVLLGASCASPALADGPTTLLRVLVSGTVEPPALKEDGGAELVANATDGGWEANVTFDSGEAFRQVSISWPEQADGSLPSLVVRVPYNYGPVLEVQVPQLQLGEVETGAEAVRRMNSVLPRSLPEAGVLSYVFKARAIARERTNDFQDTSDPKGWDVLSVYLYVAAVKRAAAILSLVPPRDTDSAIAWLASVRPNFPDGVTGLPDDAWSLGPEIDGASSGFVKSIYTTASSEECSAGVPHLRSLVSGVERLGRTTANAIWEAQGIGPLHILNAITRCIRQEAQVAPTKAATRDLVQPQMTAISMALGNDPWSNGTFQPSAKYNEDATARHDLVDLQRLLDLRGANA